MAKSIIGTDPDQCPTNADLGTMAFQDKDSVKIDGGVANNVVITGGSINNTPIGATTPSTGAFTTLSATGNTTLGVASTNTVTIQAGTAAAPALTFAGDTNTGIYAVGADAIGISTGGVVRLQVAADGGVGLDTAPIAGRRLSIAGSITGATTGYGQVISGTFQSDVTVTGVGISTYLQTQAATFTLSNIYHYFAQQGTIGAGSTLTAQNGFIAAASLIGATNNYGFRGQIPSGTGRWNLYMDGTAVNYLAGELLLGTTTSTGHAITAAGNINLLAATTEARFIQIGQNRTGNGDSFIDLCGDGTYTDYGARLIRNAGANTGTNLYHRGTGPLALITQDAGPITLWTAATKRMAILATGEVGVGADPTAGQGALQVTGDTKLAGNLQVTGTTNLDGPLTAKTTATIVPVSTEVCALQIGHGRTNDANAYIDLVGDSTYTDYGARLIRSSGANSNTILYHRGTGLLSIMAQDAGIVSLGTANIARLRVEADGKVGVGRVATTNTLEVQGAISAWGTSASIGYAVGTGGAVTQATSRTTGVTLNKINGSITLVSASGSTAWQSFTVTNSMVAATDMVRVCQKSGTDLYQIHVTNVAAGSFQITFATTGGTTTEQPVFNFTIIKGVNS